MAFPSKIPEVNKKETEVHSYLTAIITGSGMIAGVATGNIPMATLNAIQFAREVFGVSIKSKETDLLIQIREAILELEQKIEAYKINNLKKNDVFGNTFLQVIELARKTPSEKFEMLRNYTLNSALPLTISQDVHWMYLRYISELTPTHIRILTFFSNPRQWFDNYNINISKDKFETAEQALMKAMPTLEEYRIQFSKDLIDRGLLDTDGWLQNSTPHHVSLNSHITKSGKIFLEMLKDPRTSI